MKTSNFNTYYENINQKFWEKLCVNEGELRHYDKGDFFVEQGCSARYIGFIKSGTLKYVIRGDDGAESVIGLEYSGGFVADFPFSLYGKKSRVSIIAISPCDIYCISAIEIGARMSTDHELFRIVAETNIALFDTVYDRYIDLYSRTAQERYDKLIEEHENIFSLFALRDIASFLNITPTHLSRLRANSSKRGLDS